MENTSNKIKFVYTSEAEKLLPEYESWIRNEFEEEIRSKKYIFGDSVIEITGSDVQAQIDKIRLQRFYNNRNNESRAKYRAITLIYGVAGILLMLTGLYLNSLIEILFYQPQRAFLILSGLLAIIFSSVLWIFLKQRDENYVKKSVRENLDKNEALIREKFQNAFNIENSDLGTGEKLSSLEGSEPPHE